MSDDDLGRRTARATLVTRAFLLVAIVLGTAILYLLVSVAVNTNKAIDGIEEQQDTGSRTLELIEDCNTPEGECAKLREKRAQGAVSDIGRVTVLAAACAAGIDVTEVARRADAIEECVTDLLDRRR